MHNLSSFVLVINMTMEKYVQEGLSKWNYMYICLLTTRLGFIFLFVNVKYEDINNHFVIAFASSFCLCFHVFLLPLANKPTSIHFSLRCSNACESWFKVRWLSITFRSRMYCSTAPFEHFFWAGPSIRSGLLLQYLIVHSVWAITCWNKKLGWIHLNCFCYKEHMLRVLQIAI